MSSLVGKKRATKDRGLYHSGEGELGGTWASIIVLSFTIIFDSTYEWIEPLLPTCTRVVH